MFWFRDFIVRPIFHFFYNLKIEGKENIPKGRRFIYTGNHVSILDPPLVACATNDPIAFMAKKELFEDDERFQWLVKRLGAFAVDRDKPEIATFKTVKDILSTAWSLGIFPQGRIHPVGKIENIHKGFAVIAKSAKADIIPVAVCGFDGYASGLFDKHLTLKICKPISYKLDVDEIVYLWAQAICDATGFENCMEKPEASQNKQLC